jgi:hypothetical protein
VSYRGVVGHDVDRALPGAFNFRACVPACWPPMVSRD